MDFAVKEGNYLTLGVMVEKNQVTFTFEGEKEDLCRIVLISKKTQEREYIEVPREYCLGALRSITVLGMQPQEYNYLYEINGMLFTDPYARVIAGREIWNDTGRMENTTVPAAGILSEHFRWGEDKHPELPKSKMIMYKLHVRGFSMGNRAAGKSRGTFAAVKNKIPYFKSLGITTLEFMPIYEFEELPLQKELPHVPDYVKWDREKEDLILPMAPKAKDGRINYWGYGQGNYFAVKASYATEPQRASTELKKLVKALHENEMECVMEIFFPKDTNHNLILDALRYWVKEYHVDGFHIIGAHLPITGIVQDAVLSRTKLFAEHFDGVQNSRKYKNLFIYKEEYQYPARQLLNHYECDIREFVNQQKKQSEDFGFVNFIASNNGFTLADLFRYNDKHNEENGENNCDGPSYNLSNNYGIEGPTGKKYITAIRKRRTCMAYMMLMFAQGIPLIQAGDEFGNSQNGNNNAYCQDNEIGWLNWSDFSKTAAEREVLKQLIAFRKSHSLLTKEQPYKFNDYRATGAPDLSFHGEYAWISQLDSGRKSLGMLYSGAYAGDVSTERNTPCACDIYVGYNFYSEKVSLALPKIADGKKKKEWYVKMDSSMPQVVYESEQLLEDQQYMTLEPYSICLLIGKSRR